MSMAFALENGGYGVDQIEDTIRSVSGSSR